MKGEPILPVINRSLLIVYAKEPFVEWLCSLPVPSEHADMFLGPKTLESINRDPPCFLIPNDCDPQDALEHYFPIIIHELFSAWSTDENQWPDKFNLRTFKKWFDVKSSMIIHDCNGKEPLDYDV